MNLTAYINHLKDWESVRMTIDPTRWYTPQTPPTFDNTLNINDIQEKSVDHLKSMVGFLKRTHRTSDKWGLIQIYTNGIMHIVQSLHRLENSKGNIPGQLPKIVDFLENHKKQSSLIWWKTFSQEIKISIEKTKEALAEYTEHPRYKEFQDLIKKSEQFHKEEKVLWAKEIVWELMFEDTEGSQSLHNAMIDLHKNYHDLEDAERIILELLELVHAEYTRIQLMKYFWGKNVKKALMQRKEIANKIEDNKFFQISNNFQETSINIDTEQLIQQVEIAIDDILSANNIEEMKNMEPIMNYVEDDFLDVTQKISMLVEYIFQYGDKKEKKKLASTIKKIPNTNYAENELKNYLQFLSEKKENDNKKSFFIQVKEANK